MKQSLALGVVAALALCQGVAPVQAAAPGPPAVAAGPQAAQQRAALRTINGEVVSYAGGKLRVTVRGKASNFVVAKTSQCGVVRKGAGTTISCASLGGKQYRGKRVRVSWYFDGRKRRVAALVAVTVS